MDMSLGGGRAGHCPWGLLRGPTDCSDGINLSFLWLFFFKEFSFMGLWKGPCLLWRKKWVMGRWRAPGTPRKGRAETFLTFFFQN